MRQIVCPLCGGSHDIEPGALLRGEAPTLAQIRASRENGKKGGRPRSPEGRKRRATRTRLEKLQPGEPDPRD